MTNLRKKAAWPALIAWGCISGQPAYAQEGGFPFGVLAAPGGRYVFGQVSRHARHQYMLDTQTGRLWQIVCLKPNDKDASECDQTILADVRYYGGGGISQAVPPAIPK